MPAYPENVRSPAQTGSRRGPAKSMRMTQFGHWTAVSRLGSIGEQGAKPFTRQRTIVVDPGDRWQLRQVRCIRQHFRKRHSARKLCEESLIHSAVQSAVDWGGWHGVFK